MEALGPPLFVPNPDSPLFCMSLNEQIPQMELKRETEAYEMAERNVNTAIVAQAL